MPSLTMPQLKREVGAFQFFAFALGAVVGVGWAVVMGDWLRQAGPLGAIVGLASGGLFIVLIGLCYAEIAALIPAAGGEMAYAYETFGEGLGFITGWALSFIYIVVAGFEAISIGWILGALIPGIEGPVLYTSMGGEVRAGTLALGLVGMALLTWLNYRGLKLAARAQDALVVVLLVMATVFILAGIIRGDPANLRPYFQRSESGSIWPGILALFMTASFWFGGFNVVPTIMEEKSSATSFKRIGVMIVLSILIGILFKTAVVLSASMTMPWRQLMTMNIPAAAAFETALGSVILGKLVLLTALLALLSTWNAMIVSGSRMLFALGRSRFIVPSFGTVHPRFGSPGTAILVAGVFGAVVTMLGRKAILPIVNASATCLAFAYLFTCLGVWRLRRTSPEAPRPFKVPGGKLTMAVAIAGAAFSLGLSVYQPYLDAKGKVPLEWLMLTAWLVLGALCWVVAGRVRGAFDKGARRRIILGGG
ncbi:MAG: APC family permease [Gemmatimonadaceae bacterium]